MVSVAPSDPREFEFEEVEKPNMMMNASDLYNLGSVKQEQAQQ